MGKEFATDPAQVVHPLKTSLTHMADQLWNPSPIPNNFDETRAELVEDLARYALTF